MLLLIIPLLIWGICAFGNMAFDSHFNYKRINRLFLFWNNFISVLMAAAVAGAIALDGKPYLAPLSILLLLFNGIIGGVQIEMFCEEFGYFLRLIYSKKRWIRKAARKLEKFSDYTYDVGNSEIEAYNDKIFSTLINILNLCKEYNIPSYFVESVFDVDLQYLIDASKAYSKLSKKNQLCQSAISKEKDELENYLERFKKKIDEKHAEIKTMVKNGEFSNGDHFLLHDKMAQLDCILPKEEESEKDTANKSQNDEEGSKFMTMQMQ